MQNAINGSNKRAKKSVVHRSTGVCRYQVAIKTRRYILFLPAECLRLMLFTFWVSQSGGLGARTMSDIVRDNVDLTTVNMKFLIILRLREMRTIYINNSKIYSGEGVTDTSCMGGGGPGKWAEHPM